MYIYIHIIQNVAIFFSCRWGWSKTPKFDPGQRDQHLQLGGNHVVKEVPGELMEPGHSLHRWSLQWPSLELHRTSSFRFQSQRLSLPYFSSLSLSFSLSLSLSLYLYTPWHGGDGTKPPPKPLWIAEYTDYETISMRMITVRRRTAFGHGDQYHRDAMGPSSLYFSVKTIPG